MTHTKEKTQNNDSIQLVGQMNLRLLTLVTGIGLIITIITLTLVMGFLETRKHAELINLSGQQRMLSQRIALLSNLYTDPRLDPLYLMTIATQIHETADWMADNHAQLLNEKRRQSMSPEVKALYFGPAAYVDKDTQYFISTARDIVEENLSKPEEKKALDNLYLMSRDAFITNLDQIVTAYQFENHERVAFLSKILIGSVILSLGTFLFAIFGIFRPVIRQIRTDVLERMAVETKVQNALKVISDSINYASRIQQAILPEKEEMNKVVPEHFILWEPRDVVGGDIYWQRYWGPGSLIVLGDCTGHGVPGAFMTLICNGALDEAYLETPPGDPGTLLQRMHQLVQALLGQDKEGGSKSNDGIELGACYLDEDNKTLIFAGARFDLFIVENGEITFIKGTKAALGYNRTPFDARFDNHTIHLTPDQTFYMTSDGLIDQPGGEKRRGFGKKRFKSLLLSLDGLPVDQHGSKIMDTLTTYQGDEKRRDDVSVIGFKINQDIFAEAQVDTKDFDFLLSLNCRQLDEDHRKLHKMIQQLKQCLENQEGDQAAILIIKELASYTQWHFRHEERLMRTSAFSEMKAHKKEHENLIAQIQEILARLDDPETSFPITIEHTDFLNEWLTEHILGLDRTLASFLNNLETSQEQKGAAESTDDTITVEADKEFDHLLVLKYPELDQDHRNLYRMVKKLEENIKKGEGDQTAEVILHELASYTSWHFRHEERLMTANRFPGMEQHKKEHQKLLVQVNKIQADLLDPEKDSPISLDLIAFLQNWLKDHILGTDHQLAAFLNHIEADKTGDKTPVPEKNHKRRWSDVDREFDALLVLKCPELDEDHRKLYRMVKKLEASIERNEGEAEAINIINELVSYTQWHFRHEERLMHSHRYPELPDHKKEHEDLIAQVQEIQQTFDTDTPHPVSLDLTAFLHEWVQNHILECDHKLGIFLNSLEKEFLSEQEVTTESPESDKENKEFFTLGEELKIGFDAFDKEHMELTDIMNQFHTFIHVERRKKEILKRFNYLAEYMEWHIANEERLMKSWNFPEISAHKKEHKKLSVAIEAIRKEFQGGDAQAPMRLLTLIKNYLIDHIGIADQSLAAYIKKG